MKELKSLKDFLEKVSQLTTSYEDIGVLIEMAYDENDESLVPEIESELTAFQQGYEEIRIQTLLSGEYDKDNAIVTLHAGAGGTESCDWANMLYRMYTRWAERKGFSVEVLDFLDGDVAGLKAVTFQVNGENAYGYLKSEKGYTVLCAFRRLMRLESDRHRLRLVMLFRILRTILTLNSMTMI